MSRTLRVVVVLFALVVGTLPAVAAEKRHFAGSAKGSALEAAGQLVGVVKTTDGSQPGRVLISLSGPSGTSLVIADDAGRFEFRSLIPGRYLLRTHFTSTAGSRHVVEIKAESIAFESVVIPAAQASSNTMQLAGFGISPAEDLMLSPSANGVAQPGPQSSDGMDDVVTDDPKALAPHDHSVKAWRLRHARRSVLKDRGFVPVASNDTDGVDRETDLTGLDRIVMDPLGDGVFDPETDFMVGAPVSGEVQLLTRSTMMGVGQLWSPDSLSGQVASVSFTPKRDADWAVRGAFEMAAGRTPSWVVSGWYVANPHDDHDVQLAMSYSKQAYTKAGDFLPEISTLTSVGNPSREVGSIDALDSWSVSPGVTLDYGATFARYGYLKDGTLLSPRAAVSITPFQRTRVRVAASQTMTAPGAEQFLPPIEGVWLPPERTFTSLSGFDDLQAERSVHFEVGLEQRVGAATVLGVRRFNQNVNDQLITMFENGSHVPVGTLPAPGGHYYLASVSGMTTNGWGVSFSHDVEGRVRGKVDYSLVRAEWLPSPSLVGTMASGLSPTTVGVLRAGFDRFHDVTTTVETNIPETATRVVARCRVNNAFAHAYENMVTAGLDARFDIRVMQALPFSPIEGSSWELLIAVRSMFYEQVDGGSVYDELLVIDSPRQFVGGLVVHF